MNTNDFEEKKVIKKRIKELKFLDPKIAQNLSIFLSSFRMPYEEIKKMILEVDETQLSESLIQNLLKHLPDEEQLNSLSQFKSDYNNLCEPEQFAVTLKDIKSADQKTTLLHFLVDICEEKYPDILHFVDDFAHLDKASRVSVEMLEKNLKQMGRQLQQLEKNLETFPPPEDLHDKFVIKMSISL